MAGARRPTAPSSGAKRGRDQKNAQLSTSSSAEKPIFFSLEPARFSNVRTRLQVVSITVPLAHLKKKQAIHDLVLKKVLHRPFSDEPTASAPTSSSSGGAVTAATRVLSNDDESRHTTPTVPSAAPATMEIDEVVHVGKMEVQADSARQVNAAGDVQLSIMTTLLIARVHHGLIVGASSASEFSECMTVAVPIEGTTRTKLPRTESPHAQTALASEAIETPDGTDSTLLITVRCLEDEPVVAGQSVIVVSEPGGTLRCLAVRPPRAAPGPFSLVAGGDARDPFHTPASQVRIECDIPASADGETDDAKKKKPGKGAPRTRGESAKTA